MKAATRFRVVLVTAPDLKTARRLAACANVIPGLESHYWWRGKMELGREVLLLFKTRSSLLRNLERLILAEHPYDTPEFLVLTPTAGAEKYLAWLKQETEQGDG